MGKPASDIIELPSEMEEKKSKWNQENSHSKAFISGRGRYEWNNDFSVNKSDISSA